MMSAPFFWDTSKKQGAQSNFEPRFRRVDPPDLNTKPKKGNYSFTVFILFIKFL